MITIFPKQLIVASISFMNDKFLKPYDPSNTESRIYEKWENSGFFNPDKCIENGYTDSDAEHFSGEVR